MAEYNNGLEGNGYLAIRMEIQRVEPEQGTVNRNEVYMNSVFTLVWIEISYWVGKQSIFSQKVLIHSDDLISYTHRVEDAIMDESEEGTKRFYFDIANPELIIWVTQKTGTIKRSELCSEFPIIDPSLEKEATILPEQDFEKYSFYELLVVVDTCIAAKAGVWGQGPAMYFEPSKAALLQFMRDLRSETQIALLLRDE